MKPLGAIMKWLKTTAKEMHESDEGGMAHIFLDHYRDCCLAVGWLGGYDADDKFVYHSKRHPTYCLNAAIVKYNPADCCDLEWSEMPHDPENGDVYDTQNTLGDATDWEWLAKWYVKEYKKIMKELEKGTLV